MKKGISLVALIITIIVLIILTAAVVLTGANVPQNAQLAVFYNDLSSVQDATTLKMLDNMSKYATTSKNLDLCKWIDVIYGYNIANVEANENPVFNTNIDGVQVAPISDEMAGSLSIDKNKLGPDGEFYISGDGVVYHKGFYFNGVTYYGKNVTTNVAVVEKYNVIISEGIVNGTITSSKSEEIFENEQVTLTIIPTDGNSLVTLTVNGIKANVIGNEYTFNMPAENAIIDAIFLPTPTSIYAALTTDGVLLLNNVNDFTGYTIAEGKNYGNIASPLAEKVTFRLNINKSYSVPKWYDDKSSIISVNVLNQIQPVGEMIWFPEMPNMISISNISNIDTRYVTDMSYAFRKVQLDSLDLSSWNVENVRNMEGLFSSSTLRNVILNNWDTSKVENMRVMFYYNDNLQSLDLSHWNTSSLKNTSRMFCGCESLISLNVSTWETEKLIDISEMFDSCRILKQLDLSGWNVSNVENMSGIFFACFQLNSVGDISGWQTGKSKDMSNMFAFCQNLTQLNLSNWNLENVEDINSMFVLCQKMTNLGDISNWNTEKVKNMKSVFASCDVLSSLDLSGWKVQNVENMDKMFWYSYSLTTVGDLSEWQTNNVTSMDQMFLGCIELAAIDGISNWNTENVINMDSMFSICQGLRNLDISNWNTENVTNMNSMFRLSLRLGNLDLSNWNTKNVVLYEKMFESYVGEVTVGSNWNSEMTAEATGYRLDDFTRI